MITKKLYKSQLDALAAGAAMRFDSRNNEIDVCFGFCHNLKRSKTMKIFNLLFLPIVCATLSFSSGCATSWVANEYGRTHGVFQPTGPVRGDSTQVYAQGEMKIYHGICHDGSPPRKSLPAYLFAEFRDGQIINKEIREGFFPALAFDFPEIAPILLPEGMSADEIKEFFVESGRETGVVLGAWWSLYVKNSNDIGTPHVIWFMNDKKQYFRTTWGKITYPIVLTGAVAVDVIASPVYFVGGIVLFVVIAVYGI